ncbi:hypothetical protein WN944_009308 [Citrus x changshan-huyou]|uniref:Uncharacterized protein n=1 Tax=Citrus x changshan-huyou TaxID=2935761 RepID=A0AAP0MRI4_9ROSI
MPYLCGALVDWWPASSSFATFSSAFFGVQGLKPYQSPYKEVDIDNKENPVPWPCQLVSSLSRAYVQCKKHLQEVLN